MDNIVAGKSEIPLQLKAFHTLVGFVVFFSLISIPAESQIILLMGVKITSDFLWWPVVFCLFRIIYNVYGFEYYRHAIYLVIIFRVVYILFLKIAILLPASSFWSLENTYNEVLGRSFFYLVKSSLIIWYSLLIFAKQVKRFLFEKIMFILSFLIFLSFNLILSTPISINKYSYFLAPISIYIILSIIFGWVIRYLSGIENIQNRKENQSIFSIKLPDRYINKVKFFKYHHILFCSGVVFFIASKTMAAKFITIGFFTINVGGVVFSLAYLASDIMTDVYGIERTKQMILFVIFANLLFVFDVWITGSLSIDSNGSFGKVLHNQARLFISSAIAFFLGMTINSLVITIIKNKQRRRGISLKKEFITTVWTRVATSSAFGILLDVSLFSLVAFYSMVPSEKLLNIIIFEDIYKISYEIILAPFSVFLIYLLKVKERIDIYDTLSSMNPFKINTTYDVSANKFYENYLLKPRESHE